MAIVRIGGQVTMIESAETIGAKAANLARVAALGLPVPPAFVLPIKLCAAIVKGDAGAERRLREGLDEGIAFLESVTDRRFGDRRKPLLVSVRSGAARSMPGMLDTVLDVGCTLAATHGLVRMTGNPHFAWDCRRRLIDGYAGVVLDLESAPFARHLAEVMADESVSSERDLDCEAQERLAVASARLMEDRGSSLPEDPMEQLIDAARAVYRSWMSERAATYRRLEKLEYLEGTAVAVQAMVFGNRGLTSGAGVAFSRDPSSGMAQPVVEILFDAQGEDVVSGRRTPDTEAAITQSQPAIAAELRRVLEQLEQAFGDVQDVEFTIEDGRLWILQTRPAKRTPLAALRIAVDLVKERLITPVEGLRRLEGLDLQALSRARFAEAGEPVLRGVAASSGVAVGRVAFDVARAERLAAGGDDVILVRPDTSTADVAGFAVCVGIVTAVGGRTAHAALVARQMARPCVVGCSALVIDSVARRAQLGKVSVGEGEWISVDGNDGTIYLGRQEVALERPAAELAEVESWRATAKSRRSADAR